MKRHLTYRALEVEPSYEYPVDQAVRLRVGRRDLQRTAANSSTAIVKALGRRRKLWFTYELAADEMRALREAAYFDAGVEQGIAAARANALLRPSKKVRVLAERIVQETLRSGVACSESVEATLVAAWSLLGEKTATFLKRAAR